MVTLLDSDHDFGKIEIQLKKAGNVYTSDQYKNIILSAQKKNPFVVTDIGKSMYDCKMIMNLLGLVNRKVTTGTKFLVSKVMWLKIREFEVMELNEEWRRTHWHMVMEKFEKYVWHPEEGWPPSAQLVKC